MREAYRIWEYPEASETHKGEILEHKSVKANIRTVNGAMHIFCAITGWMAVDLEADTDSWEYQHVEFHHKTVGHVGGIGR